MSKPDVNGLQAAASERRSEPPASPTTDALRQWLDAQTDQFDASTLQQLGRVRRAAVAEAGQVAVERRSRWLLGGAAASVCLVVLLALQLSPLQKSAVPPAPTSMETFMMLASPESEDMLESMDFYLWLEAQEVESESGDDRAG